MRNRFPLGLVVSALIVLPLVAALLLRAPVVPQTMSTPDDAAVFEAKLRQILLDKPEVLVEALNVYRMRAAVERQAENQRALASLRPQLEAESRDPISGNPDGRITVVEFFDYNCPYCRRSVPVIAELLEQNPDIRYVYKEFPILAESSHFAARLALAVHRLQPELYEPFHVRLLEQTGRLTEERVLKIAGALGVNLEPAVREMEHPEVVQAIEANLALARSLSITGTPTFVIGERVLKGLQPLEELQAAIEEVDGGES
jgi:protein-disulfide isomerase